MEEGGETYYWNEFNLVSDSGESATLVYEETERGGEWRIFTLFEPQSPMTVPEAAAQRVGHTVNLEGQPIPVTLVDESCVYHIEGEAPEGVEVGDIAHYFNAGADNRMIVVSWTGDEIEFYRGLNLPRGTVASAFGLPSDVSDAGSRTSGTIRSASASKVISAIVVFLACVILFAALASRRSARQSKAVVKTGPPPSALALGGTGVLEGKKYRIGVHTVVEIARVGQIFERHEYHLTDEAGNRALLIYGSQPAARNWLLYAPIEPAISLTPQQAAAKRIGETVITDATAATISDLFQLTIRQVESLETSELKSGEVLYGFGGKSGDALILARWNTNGVAFYKGKALKEVAAAFSQKVEK
jgi:hypothetical protein